MLNFACITLLSRALRICNPYVMSFQRVEEEGDEYLDGDLPWYWEEKTTKEGFIFYVK